MTKTTAIKARIANHIRKTLYKKHLPNISDKEKLQIFDEIFGINLQMHWELNAYKAKRKVKAAIHAERVKRGYKPKKKTSFSEHLKQKT